MSEQENLRVVRAMFDAWNAHDGDRLVTLLDEGFVSESDTLPGPVRGPEAQRQVLEMYVRAFPNLHLEVEQMLASGEYVVSRWHATGTHKGELMGIPPTNRRGEGVRGCTVGEVRNGKVLREWVYWDVATLLRQLGVMPAPAAASVAR